MFIKSRILCIAFCLIVFKLNVIWCFEEQPNTEFDNGNSKFLGESDKLNLILQLAYSPDVQKQSLKQKFNYIGRNDNIENAKKKFGGAMTVSLANLEIQQNRIERLVIQHFQTIENKIDSLSKQMDSSNQNRQNRIKEDENLKIENIHYTTTEYSTSTSKASSTTTEYVSPLEAICGGDLFVDDEYHLVSPNYPDTYLPNMLCIWRIEVPNGYKVSLEFNYFDIENTYDYVEVRDGKTQYAELIGSFNGHGRPPKIQSSGNTMFVNFVSDGSLQYEGFSAIIKKEFFLIQL